jgi:hypothetical protein
VINKSPNQQIMDSGKSNTTNVNQFSTNISSFKTIMNANNSNANQIPNYSMSLAARGHNNNNSSSITNQQ